MSGQPETSHTQVTRRRKRSDRYSLCIALVVDLLVAVAVSFRDAYFWWNLAYFWLPQLVMLGILTTFKLKPAVLVGTVYAWALHLALFGIVALVMQVPNPTVWAWYFVSLPGSVVGAVAGFTITSRTRPGSRRIVYLTGLGTFTGALLAQALALLVVFIDSMPSQNRAPTRSRRAEHHEIHHSDHIAVPLIAIANQSDFNPGMDCMERNGAQERT